MSVSVEDYRAFRGKCREMSEALVAADPTLRLVRGHYHCWQWGPQPHWWCVKPDGTIIDPTVDQFPKPHVGTYVEFNGICECAECSKEVPEADAIINGNYAFCSNPCAMRFVGLL